jgi:hypothetical protein
MNISKLNYDFMLGFYILTATFYPFFNLALCTYAIDALATGCSSK